MRNNHTKDPWYRCALYEVWRDMMKNARRMSKIIPSPDGFPVDPIFRGYPEFVLWARLAKGYKIGEMDDYRLERHRSDKMYDPYNCFFTKKPAAVGDFDISRGAKCEFKQDKSSRNDWNGLSRSRLYDIWKSMHKRCEIPSCKDYPDYGGRGIAVCKEWNDFLSFYDWSWEHGYSPYLSLDRIDVNGGYCPENCRWAGELEQMLNKRKYNQMYKNLRLKVKDMRNILNSMDDNVVVTLVSRACYLPVQDIAEADYPQIPKSERIDVERRK